MGYRGECGCIRVFVFVRYIVFLCLSSVCVRVCLVPRKTQAQRWQTCVNILTSRHHQGVGPRQQHPLGLGAENTHRTIPKLLYTI